MYMYKSNCFYTLCVLNIYNRVVVAFGTTVHMATFYLNACNLSHLVSSAYFYLQIFVVGVPLFVVP